MKKVWLLILTIGFVLGGQSVKAETNLSLGLAFGGSPDIGHTTAQIYKQASQSYSNISVAEAQMIAENLKHVHGLTGFELGIDLELNWKFLFIRTGFVFKDGTNGGASSLPHQIINDTGDTTFFGNISINNNYLSTNFPLIIGLNYVSTAKIKFYLGLGLRYHLGKFTSKIYAEGEQFPDPIALPDVQSHSTSNIFLTAQNNCLGFTFVTGGQVAIIDQLSFFAEYQYDAASKVVVANLNHHLMVEENLAVPLPAVDTTSEEKKAQIVDHGGQTFRFGLKYKIYQFN